MTIINYIFKYTNQEYNRNASQNVDLKNCFLKPFLRIFLFFEYFFILFCHIRCFVPNLALHKITYAVNDAIINNMKPNTVQIEILHKCT